MTGLNTRQTSDYEDNNLGLTYIFVKGVPVSLTERATPFLQYMSNNETGIYAQDVWTVKRLTLSLGLRYDQWHSYYPDHFFGSGPNTPTRSFTIPPGDFYDSKDLNPSVGAAYDPFANG